MPDLRIQETIGVLGYSFPADRTITSDGAVVKAITVPAAKSGALTTRTDDNTGTLTMDSGHGIQTGDRLDLYWDGGSRRGIVVGTVSVDSVPFDLGSGDNLPADETDITAMVPIEEEFLLTGDNAEALLFYSQRAGTIVLAESDDSEADARVLEAGVSSVWTLERDATIPVAGVNVAKVFFSHGDSANTSIMRAIALVG